MREIAFGLEEKFISQSCGQFFFFLRQSSDSEVYSSSFDYNLIDDDEHKLKCRQKKNFPKLSCDQRLRFVIIQRHSHKKKSVLRLSVQYICDDITVNILARSRFRSLSCQRR